MKTLKELLMEAGVKSDDLQDDEFMEVAERVLKVIKIRCTDCGKPTDISLLSDMQVTDILPDAPKGARCRECIRKQKDEWLKRKVEHATLMKEAMAEVGEVFEKVACNLGDFISATGGKLRNLNYSGGRWHWEGSNGICGLAEIVEGDVWVSVIGWPKRRKVNE